MMDADCLIGNLVFVNGPEEKNFPLRESPCIIGRNSECQIRLKDTNVGERHCILHISQGKWVTVHSVDPNYPVKVNEEEVSGDGHLLQNGDIINISNILFRWQKVENENASLTKTARSSFCSESVPKIELEGKRKSAPGCLWNKDEIDAEGSISETNVIQEDSLDTSKRDSIEDVGLEANSNEELSSDTVSGEENLVLNRSRISSKRKENNIDQNTILENTRHYSETVSSKRRVRSSNTFLEEEVSFSRLSADTKASVIDQSKNNVEDYENCGFKENPTLNKTSNLTEWTVEDLSDFDQNNSEDVPPQQNKENSQGDISKTTDCLKQNELFTSESKSPGELCKASRSSKVSSEQDTALESDQSDELDLQIIDKSDSTPPRDDERIQDVCQSLLKSPKCSNSCPIIPVAKSNDELRKNGTPEPLVIQSKNSVANKAWSPYHRDCRTSVGESPGKFRGRRSTGIVPNVGTPSDVYRIKRSILVTPAVRSSRDTAPKDTEIPSISRQPRRRSSERKSTPLKNRISDRCIQRESILHSPIIEDEVSEKCEESQNESLNNDSKYKFVQSRRRRLCGSSFATENRILEESETSRNTTGGTVNNSDEEDEGNQSLIPLDPCVDSNMPLSGARIFISGDRSNVESDVEDELNSTFTLGTTEPQKEDSPVEKVQQLKSILTPLPKAPVLYKEKSAKKVTFACNVIAESYDQINGDSSSKMTNSYDSSIQSSCNSNDATETSSNLYSKIEESLDSFCQHEELFTSERSRSSVFSQNSTSTPMKNSNNSSVSSEKLRSVKRSLNEWDKSYETSGTRYDSKNDQSSAPSLTSALIEEDNVDLTELQDAEKEQNGSVSLNKTNEKSSDSTKEITDEFVTPSNSNLIDSLNDFSDSRKCISGIYPQNFTSTPVCALSTISNDSVKPSSQIMIDVADLLKTPCTMLKTSEYNKTMDNSIDIFQLKKMKMNTGVTPLMDQLKLSKTIDSTINMSCVTLNKTKDCVNASLMEIDKTVASIAGTRHSHQNQTSSPARTRSSSKLERSNSFFSLEDSVDSKRNTPRVSAISSTGLANNSGLTNMKTTEDSRSDTPYPNLACTKRSAGSRKCTPATDIRNPRMKLSSILSSVGKTSFVKMADSMESTPNLKPSSLNGTTSGGKNTHSLTDNNLHNITELPESPQKTIAGANEIPSEENDQVMLIKDISTPDITAVLEAEESSFELEPIEEAETQDVLGIEEAETQDVFGIEEAETQLIINMSSKLSAPSKSEIIEDALTQSVPEKVVTEIASQLTPVEEAGMQDSAENTSAVQNENQEIEEAETQYVYRSLSPCIEDVETQDILESVPQNIEVLETQDVCRSPSPRTEDVETQDILEPVPQNIEELETQDICSSPSSRIEEVETQDILEPISQNIEEAETQYVCRSPLPRIKDVETQDILESIPQNIEEAETQYVCRSPSPCTEEAETQYILEPASQNIEETATPYVCESRSPDIEEIDTQDDAESVSENIEDSDCELSSQNIEEAETQFVCEPLPQTTEESEVSLVPEHLSLNMDTVEAPTVLNKTTEQAVAEGAEANDTGKCIPPVEDVDTPNILEDVIADNTVDGKETSAVQGVIENIEILANEATDKQITGEAKTQVIEEKEIQDAPEEEAAMTVIVQEKAPVDQMIPDVPQEANNDTINETGFPETPESVSNEVDTNAVDMTEPFAEVEPISSALATIADSQEYNLVTQSDLNDFLAIAERNEEIKIVVDAADAESSTQTGESRNEENRLSPHSKDLKQSSIPPTPRTQTDTSQVRRSKRIAKGSIVPAVAALLTPRANARRTSARMVMNQGSVAAALMTPRSTSRKTSAGMETNQMKSASKRTRKDRDNQENEVEFDIDTDITPARKRKRTPHQKDKKIVTLTTPVSQIPKEEVRMIDAQTQTSILRDTVSSTERRRRALKKLDDNSELMQSPSSSSRYSDVISVHRLSSSAPSSPFAMSIPIADDNMPKGTVDSNLLGAVPKEVSPKHKRVSKKQSDLGTEVYATRKNSPKIASPEASAKRTRKQKTSPASGMSEASTTSERAAKKTRLASISPNGPVMFETVASESMSKQSVKKTSPAPTSLVTSPKRKSRKRRNTDIESLSEVSPPKRTLRAKPANKQEEKSEAGLQTKPKRGARGSREKLNECVADQLATGTKPVVERLVEEVEPVRKVRATRSKKNANIVEESTQRTTRGKVASPTKTRQPSSEETEPSESKPRSMRNKRTAMQNDTPEIPRTKKRAAKKTDDTKAESSQPSPVLVAEPANKRATRTKAKKQTEELIETEPKPARRKPRGKGTSSENVVETLDNEVPVKRSTRCRTTRATSAKETSVARSTKKTESKGPRYSVSIKSSKLKTVTRKSIADLSSRSDCDEPRNRRVTFGKTTEVAGGSTVKSRRSMKVTVYRNTTQTTAKKTKGNTSQPTIRRSCLKKTPAVNNVKESPAPTRNTRRVTRTTVSAPSRTTRRK